MKFRNQNSHLALFLKNGGAIMVFALLITLKPFFRSLYNALYLRFIGLLINFIFTVQKGHAFIVINSACNWI